MPNRSFQSRAPRHGFTLIEVLVVVAIIALLITILLPSLTRARYQAQATVCLGNLRQLGIGVIAYANTFNEYIPPVDPAQKDVGPKDTQVGPDWNYQVGSDDMSVYYPKYGPTLKLWECPAARNVMRNRDDLKLTYDQQPGYLGGESPRFGSAYEYNPWQYNVVVQTTSWPEYTMSTKPGFQYLRFHRAKRASSMCIVHDNDNSGRNWYPDGNDPHGIMDGGNMLYADGHAKWVRAKDWAKSTDGGRNVVRR